jgi:hypothetical protein
MRKEAIMVLSITLQIPDDVATRAQQIAIETAQPLEQVILMHLQASSLSLAQLPPDEQAELVALRFLTDDTLWTFALEMTDIE